MNIYEICFCGTLAALALTFVLTFITKGDKRITAGVGVGIAIAILFFPIGDRADVSDIITNILSCIFYASRVLLAGEDYETDRFTIIPENIRSGYIILVSFMYAAAPIITFGVILSFISDKLERLRLHFTDSKIYMFSCKNEKSIMIAKSISQKNIGKKQKKDLFVFYNTEETDEYELELNEINYTAVKKSIIYTDRKMLMKKSPEIYLTNDNEDVNVSDALSLMRKISGNGTDPEIHDSAYIYINIFTMHPAHELLLNSSKRNHVCLRRINENSVLVNYLLINDKDILKRFKDCVEGRKINISFFGFNKFNEELFRAFLWYFQNVGNTTLLNITIYTDDRKGAEKYLGIIGNEVSGNYGAIFDISLKDTSAYECADNTMLFIDLGNDSLNIDTALSISEKFCRKYYKELNSAAEENGNGFENFIIKTPIKQVNLDTAESLRPVNCKSNRYPIELIPYKSVYAADKLMIPKIEEIAEGLFEEWKGSTDSGNRRTVYDFDFDYRSSLSAAIFWSVMLNIDSMELYNKIKDRDKYLEHKRWAAFMLSEGYIYNPENGAFKHLAKYHNCITDWERLSKDVQDYDEFPIKAAKRAYNIGD